MACCNKSVGVLSLVKGLIHGPAPAAVAADRLAACKACGEKSTAGDRLYREIDGKAYCGVPRLQDIYRDESKDGCGCDLLFKVSRAETECPRKKWLPVSLGSGNSVEKDLPPKAEPAKPPLGPVIPPEDLPPLVIVQWMKDGKLIRTEPFDPQGMLPGRIIIKITRIDK